MLDAEETENREWVQDFVERQRRRGADFAERDGVFRRTDGLANAYWSGLITRDHMAAGRRYERDYDSLHRSGKYRSTIYRFLEEDRSEEDTDRSLEAAMSLRRARAVLTRRQRAICDAVCGEDCLLLDRDLRVALDRLFEHYSTEIAPFERADLTYRPRIKTADEKRAERIAEAIRRLQRPLGPTIITARGPASKPVAEPQEEPELDWVDFLPEKPSRSDAAMNPAWLAAQGVVRSNREMRHMGVQAKAAKRVADKASGKIRKRVRRRGNG